MATKKSKTTTKAKAKSKDLSPSQQVGIGVGLTAAAVAAAGAYFLYGSDKAEKNRATVKSWALKAKADVLEHLEDAKKMTRAEFEQVVAGVATTYASAKSATKKDVAGFATEMMQHWDKLEGSVAKKKTAAKKSTKSVAKTAAKGAATGAAKAVVKKAVKKTTTKKTTKK